MDFLRHILITAFVLVLSGCAPLSTPGGRILLLVVVPAGLLITALWLLRRRGEGRTRDRNFPDYDERD